ncbi:MAG TPA: cell division protein FtsB [Burkholderiales bacterium]|nr:cell division protein FtsB [Burkholderiales bacterium]
MRKLAIVLGVLIVAIQYPLWLGKGGWLKVWDHNKQLAAQKEENRNMQVRNDALDAEVRDLRSGLEAVEERARFEMGLIKKDEVFFQIVETPAAPAKP